LVEENTSFNSGLGKVHENSEFITEFTYDAERNISILPEGEKIIHFVYGQNG